MATFHCSCTSVATHWESWLKSSTLGHPPVAASPKISAIPVACHNHATALEVDELEEGSGVVVSDFGFFAFVFGCVVELALFAVAFAEALHSARSAFD